MKSRITRKAVVAGSTNLRSVGYCELQALLRGHDPIAYTSGVYGWNFDVYEVYGVTICTGYRGMPGKRCEGVEEYEEKARAIWSDYERYGSYEAQEAAVEELLHEFCKLNGGY